MKLETIAELEFVLKEFKQFMLEQGITEPIKIVLLWKQFIKDENIITDLPFPIINELVGNILYYSDDMAKPYREE